jgi:hypothetical protein
VKRTGRDEPVGVVIHICMETTQGNSLCSYLYLKLAKMSCFSFYLLSFFLLQNLRTGGQNRFCWGVGEVGTSGNGKGKGKKGRRINTAQIIYTHVCKCKNDTC